MRSVRVSIDHASSRSRQCEHAVGSGDLAPSISPTSHLVTWCDGLCECECKRQHTCFSFEFRCFKPVTFFVEEPEIGRIAPPLSGPAVAFYR
jgi:hypothetical protein